MECLYIFTFYLLLYYIFVYFLNSTRLITQFKYVTNLEIKIHRFTKIKLNKFLWKPLAIKNFYKNLVKKINVSLH